MFVSTEPWHSSTARGTKFSEAIISSVPLLALELAAQRVGDLGVDLGERTVEVVGGRSLSGLSSDMMTLSLAGDDD